MTSIVPSRRRPHELDVFQGFEDWSKRALGDFRMFERIGDYGLEIEPRIDIGEDEKTITIKAEMPGLDAKDLDISLENEYLTIKGEKKEEKEEKNIHFHLVERHYGSFSRTLRLPAEVKADKIDATYKNGILRVVLPKVKESKPAITHVKVH